MSLFKFVLILLFVSLIYADDQQQQQRKINQIIIGESYRLHGQPGQDYYFYFKQSELKANQNYDIKISYLGSIGVHMNIFWNDQLKFSNFRVLDTEKKNFHTNNNQQIEGLNENSIMQYDGETYYAFRIQGYREKLVRNYEYLVQPFEYIIKIEEVFAQDVPLYALQQYLLIIILSIFVSCIAMRYFDAFFKYLDQKESLNKRL